MSQSQVTVQVQEPINFVLELSLIWDVIAYDVQQLGAQITKRVIEEQLRCMFSALCRHKNVISAWKRLTYAEQSKLISQAAEKLI